VQQIAIVRRINDTVDFDIISKMLMPGVVNYLTYIINKHTERQRPQNRFLRSTGEGG
jgi:hypothetical protein